MNKTVTINLGGYFFHIDENAYQKLKNYLNAISNSLSDDPQGKKEIIADIEVRICELLSEKITDNRQVVNDSQIDEVIKIMGQPEDYGDGDTEQANQNITKKLFRDQDDRFLGGVCSGLASYMGIDNIWIRLIFLILTLLGYGFGVIAYIILWILLPVAKTTAEKLQMKGEPVTIENIEKKIRENIDYEGVKQKSQSGFQELLDVLVNLIKAVLKISVKVIGAILLPVSLIVIISLMIGLFSMSSIEILSAKIDFVSYPPFFYTSSLPNWLLVTCTFLAIMIPFIGLFIISLRLLSLNIKPLNIWVILSLVIIWFLTIFVLIFSGIEYELAEGGERVAISENAIVFDRNKPLKIGFKNNNTIHYLEKLKRKNNKLKVLVDEQEKSYSNNIYLNVKETKKDTAYVEVIKQVNFRINREGFQCDTDKMVYKYNLTDNQLVLDAYFLSDYKHLPIKEKIKVNVYVPVGVTVFFEKSSKYFIDDIKNIDKIYDREMPNHHFEMTKQGLKCMDCKTIDNDEAINVNLDNLKIDINDEGINVNSDELNIDINDEGVKLNVKGEEMKE